LIRKIAQGYRSFKEFQRRSYNAQQSASGRKVIKGEMVKDPVCNTYISKDKSIKDTIGGETFYFCSKECRDQFIKKLKAKD